MIAGETVTDAKPPEAIVTALSNNKVTQNGWCRKADGFVG